MWHYANYQGKELLVVGHSITRNDCIVVDLASLPMNEASDLRRIAQSRAGQEHERLVPLLQKVVAPDKVQDWFSYLMYKSKQRNGPVFNLPLKEIQDSLEEDQRAIFKGYGKGRRNKHLEIMSEAAAQGGMDAAEMPGELIGDVNTGTVTAPTRTDTGLIPTGRNLWLEERFDALLDETRKTQQLLGKLIGALTEEDAEPEPAPKPKRPSRVKKDAERVQA